MAYTKFLAVANTIAVAEMGFTIFFSNANSIASARNGLYKIWPQYPRSRFNSFSSSIWPVQIFLTVVISIASGRNGLYKNF